MIILIDTEKVFDKIQHPFTIKKKNTTKTLQKVGIEGIYLTIIRLHKTFSKVKNSKHFLQDLLIFTLATFIQHSSGDSSHSNRKRKGNNQTGTRT